MVQSAERLDVKRWGSYRARRGRFDVVDLPERHYLMINGHGDPNAEPFAAAIESLYPVAYTCKFAAKRELGRDHVVGPLEGLWWAEDMDTFTRRRDKSQWDWTLMLLTPEWITAEMVSTAIETVRQKKSPPRIDDVRWESLTEGRCIQTLHVGSFDDEAEVLEELHQTVIPGQGWTMAGHHHEIYLSDFRRTPEQRRRTILRQPVTAPG